MSSLDEELDEMVVRQRLVDLRAKTPNGPAAMSDAFIEEIVARRDEPNIRAFLYGLLDARDTLG